VSRDSDRSNVEVFAADLLSPEIQGLISELNAELTDRYPEEGANHFRLDAQEVAPGRGRVFLARRGKAAIACGAVRLLDDRRTGEIKRMYVVPAERGLGVGARMLAALETAARELGANRLVLETGERQIEAIALYERAGFQRIARFGEYESSPLSICMEKLL
jgi:putative acetyltransferase